MNQHIQNIEISNFKSIKDLKIDGCKKINIFAGKPNAGKSNILEALAVFQYNTDDKIRLKFHVNNDLKEYDLNDIVRFNEISDLFFDGNLNDHIKIRLDKNYTSFGFNNNSLQSLKSSLSTSTNKNGIFEYRPYIKKYSFNLKSTNISNINLVSLSYPFGENLGQIISSHSDLRKSVNKFFIENNLKLLIEKNTNEIKIFKEYQDGTVFILPYNMIADTLQRLIFYKAAMMSNYDSVLLFEEPEAHCFEPYILEFTNEVKYNKNNNQFFMVTHSDFIIQEFLRDEESRNNLQIYLVNNVDGKTEVKKLDVDKNDDVYEYGMNVFFNFDSLWENN
ncbi:AAA family ATPase [Chryseobacterium sp. POE27]|uniref:AAA family ATPase n=1 Tax=Chryseobacterium sp. POE27 TaxID=3138177 RepID=UPI0032198ABD